MTGTLVLLSGGMDSTALLARTARHEGLLEERVEALSINYGQRHVRELEAAQAVAGYFGVQRFNIDLSVLGEFLGSALTTKDREVPHGHYTSANMTQTVVPNRNAIMLSIAAGVAATRGLDIVATAVHAGDHAIYPDCRPVFIKAISQATRLGTAGIGDVIVDAPYAAYSKADIAEDGYRRGAPFFLSWSCYEGGPVHCGRCGTCVERAEAFHLADVEDPTEYADPDYWRTAQAQ